MGYPPFYADDATSTCRRILSWRSTLRFPSTPVVSDAAKDVILKLCCAAPERASFDALRAHPFFAEVRWGELRSQRAPELVIPKLSSDTDTSHFPVAELQQQGGPRTAHRRHGSGRRMRGQDGM